VESLEHVLARTEGGGRRAEAPPQADTDAGRVSGSGGRHHPSGPRGPQQQQQQQPCALHPGLAQTRAAVGMGGTSGPSLVTRKTVNGWFLDNPLAL